MTAIENLNRLIKPQRHLRRSLLPPKTIHKPEIKYLRCPSMLYSSAYKHFFVILRK